jgi:uncharacterized protein
MSETSIENISSPCIGVCTISDSSGLCQGCYRTIDEIREWWNMNDVERAKVSSLLDQRMAEQTEF